MTHRHTQFTLNEIEKFDPLKELILKKNPSYVIACQELAPTTGHKHIHVYVQWGKRTRICAKKFLGAHIENCKGTPQQNVDYIKKEGDIIFEQGTLKTNETTMFPTIAAVKAMTPEQREQLPIQYYNIVQKLNQNDANTLKASEAYKHITVIYYWGKSGVGKTKTALQYIKQYLGDRYNEVKYKDGFWLGVTNDCDVALYDDFRDSHMKPSEFINFIDYNVHNMNIKGGYIKNHYKHIFITSIQDPHTIYKSAPEEYKEQWLRRMEIRAC